MNVYLTLPYTKDELGRKEKDKDTLGRTLNLTVK